MKRFIPAMVLALALTAGLRAADPHFVKPADLNAAALLPAPPAKGSQEATYELETVLKLQATRTDAEVARAKSEAKLSPAAFQPVFGKDFTAENLPLLFALLTDAAADSKAISDPAKTQFARQRPQFADSKVQPAISGEVDGSYPSGHATRGILWASILSQIAPDKKEALLQRGEEIGWDRIIAGVHFPSDIYAGRVLGLALAHAMNNDPAFQAQFAKAKAELEAFMKTHPAPPAGTP